MSCENNMNIMSILPNSTSLKTLRLCSTVILNISGKNVRINEMDVKSRIEKVVIIAFMSEIGSGIKDVFALDLFRDFLYS